MIWNSQVDKSGKATPIDRILMICPEEAEIRAFASNNEVE